MLEVYGVTYDHTINYGSSLQAYALQQAINKLTVEGTACHYSLIPLSTFKELPRKKSLRSLAARKVVDAFRRRFAMFEEKRMAYVPVTSFKALPGLNDRADAFVCGSDVIWRPDYNRGLSAYYLDFATKYKFSYAASFGLSSIEDKTLAEAGQYIARLDQISVREESGKRIAEGITGRDVRVVGDPVLLLTKEEWEDILPRDENKGKYIFVYTTHMNPSLDAFVKKLSRQTHMNVVHTTWARSVRWIIQQKVRKIHRPDQWLQQLRDAEYVVTNSFHATVFSILFHRKFFTVVLGDKREGRNVRMNDFLKHVGLSDRILSDIPDRIDLGEIDFAAADEKVRALREESLAFLQENMEAAYRQKTGQNRDS